MEILEYLAFSGRFILLVPAETFVLSLKVMEAVSIVATVTQSNGLLQVVILLARCYHFTALLVYCLSLFGFGWSSIKVKDLPLGVRTFSDSSLDTAVGSQVFIE